MQVVSGNGTKKGHELVLNSLHSPAKNLGGSHHCLPYIILCAFLDYAFPYFSTSSLFLLYGLWVWQWFSTFGGWFFCVLPMAMMIVLFITIFKFFKQCLEHRKSFLQWNSSWVKKNCVVLFFSYCWWCFLLVVFSLLVVSIPNYTLS